MMEHGQKKKGSRIHKYSRLLAGFGSKFHILFLPPCWHKETRRFPYGEAPRVLVIGETPEEQEPLLASLHNCDLSLQITLMDSGQAALDFLRLTAGRGEPILVIIDTGAQSENGFGLVENIRANEALRNIPISIVGTTANEDHLALAIDLKAVSYVVKPTTEDQKNKLSKVFKELFSSLIEPAALTESPS